MNKKIYIAIICAFFMTGLIWCPVSYALEKAGVLEFEDLRNYKDPEKEYAEDHPFAALLNGIEKGKAELSNIYVNYFPGYSSIITAVNSIQRGIQSNFVQSLKSPEPPAGPAAASAGPLSEKEDGDTDGTADIPTEAPPVKIESTFLHDDGMHRYYKVEPYKILDRFVKDSDGSLRKKFDVQVQNFNRITEATPENVNFYLYVCTRMQDTEYFPDLGIGEYATKDFLYEFMDSAQNCTAKGYFDIGTMEKRLLHLWDTDHHWSALGAYDAYLDVIGMMAENTPEVGDPLPLNSDGLIVFEDVKARGSFASILRFEEYYDTFKVLDFTPPEFSKKSMLVSSYDQYTAGNYSKDTYADHYVSYYNTVSTRRYKLAEPKNGRNLLLIGDSYSWWFSFLIAANFDNVYIYLPPWDKERMRYQEYIEENNITDVLLIQFSDRLMFDYYGDSGLKAIVTRR